MKTISQEQVKHTTEKAILIQDGSKEFWIPKSKFADAENLTITQEVYDSYATKELEEKLVEIMALPEEHNDKSYIVKLMMSSKHEDIGNRERFWFVPKSLVREIKKSSFIVPQWCFDNGVANVIQNDINYFVSQDEKFKSLSERDFDVVTENIIIGG